MKREKCGTNLLLSLICVMDKLSRHIEIGKHELSPPTLLEDPPSTSTAIFINNECCKDGSGVLFSEQGLFTADEQEKMVLTCFLTAERCQESQKRIEERLQVIQLPVWLSQLIDGKRAEVRSVASRLDDITQTLVQCHMLTAERRATFPAQHYRHLCEDVGQLTSQLDILNAQIESLLKLSHDNADACVTNSSLTLYKVKVVPETNKCQTLAEKLEHVTNALRRSESAVRKLQHDLNSIQQRLCKADVDHAQALETQQKLHAIEMQVLRDQLHARECQLKEVHSLLKETNSKHPSTVTAVESDMQNRTGCSDVVIDANASLNRPLPWPNDDIQEVPALNPVSDAKKVDSAVRLPPSASNGTEICSFSKDENKDDNDFQSSNMTSGIGNHHLTKSVGTDVDDSTTTINRPALYCSRALVGIQLTKCLPQRLSTIELGRRQYSEDSK